MPVYMSGFGLLEVLAFSTLQGLLLLLLSTITRSGPSDAAGHSKPVQRRLNRSTYSAYLGLRMPSGAGGSFSVHYFVPSMGFPVFLLFFSFSPVQLVA